MPALGSIEGLNIIHLQCHLGTDTLSLARLGAAKVTGLDFSSASLDQARRLAASSEGGDKCTYVLSSVEDALNAVPAGTFDIVYTGIGSICWLPHIKEWARIVAALLKPGGRLYIRDAHPMLNALEQDDPDPNTPLIVDWPYFEREAVIWEGTSGYVHDEEGKIVPLKNNRTAVFNHGLGQTVQAVLEAGMRLTSLTEEDTVPWEAIKGKMCIADNGTSNTNGIPHFSTLTSTKANIDSKNALGSSRSHSHFKRSKSRVYDVDPQSKNVEHILCQTRMYAAMLSTSSSALKCMAECTCGSTTSVIEQHCRTPMPT